MQLIAILSKQLEFDSLGVIQSIDENLHQTTSSIFFFEFLNKNLNKFQPQKSNVFTDGTVQ